MRDFVIVLLFITSFSSITIAQKACNCERMDQYVKARDFDSLEVYEPQSLKIEAWKFLKLPSVRCKAYGNQLLSQYYFQQLELEKAKIQLTREKKKLDSLGCGKSAYFENSIGFAEYYYRIGDYQKAAETITPILSAIKKTGNPNLYGRALLTSSAAHSKLKDQKSALNEIKSAYSVIYLSADGTTKADNLFRLSYRYYYHFTRTNNLVYLDSSIQVADFGLTLSKRYNYADGLVQAYNLLENKAYHSNNYRMALLYLDSALAATNPAVHYNDREGIFSDKADVYLKLKQYAKAYECADSSLFYAKKLNNPYRVEEALELVYNCAKLSGDYERALDVFQDLTNMQDSVKLLESSSRYNELEDRFRRVSTAKTDTENRQDIQLLNQQKEIGQLKQKLILVGIIIFALLAIYLIMVFRQKSIKQKQDLLEKENKFNRSRVNPDFIHGALQAIQSSEDGMANEKNLQTFAKLMKRLAESANNDFFTLDKELEFIKLYLDIQRQKTNNKFSYEFEIDEQLDLQDLCIPTLMIQPFLEYSIENGFRKIAYEGNIVIRVLQTPNNELFVQIQDNGLGLKAQDFIRANQMIIDRMNVLNKMNNSSHSYVVRERQTGGMQVDIYLPLISILTAEKLMQEED